MSSIALNIRDINPNVRYVNISQYKPGQVIGPRKVYDYQFIYVHKGQGFMEIDGFRYTAQPGDLFFYGPSVLHTFIGGDENPFFLWGVHFDFTQNHAGRNVPIGGIKPDFFKNEYVTERVIFTDFSGFPPHIRMMHDPRVAEIQFHMLEEYNKGRKFNMNYLAGMLAALIALIARYTDLKEQGLLKDSSTVDKVLTYIQSNFCSDLTNKSIAGMFHFHPSYLSRLVKAQTGKSLRQYLIDLRVKKAVDLILYSNMSMDKISKEVGYEDFHYFSRLIKKKTGLSPMHLKEK